MNLSSYTLAVAAGLALTVMPSKTLATTVQPPAAAPAAGGPCIVREQAEQLITTLKQRNDQVRDLSARVREAEGRAAGLEAKAAQVDAANKVLAIAATKNRELTEIGEAILADYEAMRLGKRLAASEPLTGLYRVRLENKLQEFRGQLAAEGFYPDKELEAQRAGPPPAAAAPSAVPPAQ